MTAIQCTVTEGLLPNERVASIKMANGSIEAVEVPDENILGVDKLVAFEVGRDADGNILIELPRESVSGRWRIWVEKSATSPIGG